MAYVVTPVPRLKRSERRAIAFLTSDEDEGMDAAAVFGSLDAKRERQLRSRFDYWIDGRHQDDYFHGWPNDAKNKHCFVFKWKKGRQCHRMYGFLCHPMPNTNPRFELCVLISHAIKDKWETDPNELADANRLRIDTAVQAAVKKAYPDKAKGKPWVN